ncbi:MAG: hypothetical protein Q9160_003357 [Pyrenula sp. 1 TL-2023]
MASPIWRKLGYVPDSEDEDECSLSEQALPSSNAQRLQRHGTDELNARSEAHHSTSSPSGFKSILRNVEEPNQDFPRGSSLQQPEFLQTSNSPLTTASAADRFTLTANEASGERPAYEGYNSDESSPLSSIADELSSELEFGLQTIDEILHPSRNETQNESGISSTREQYGAPIEEREGALEDPEAQPRPQQSDLDDDECGINNEDHQGVEGSPALSQQPLQRALRHRNPIQLHPYALEFSRYQQSLKARGLRPQRIATPERERSSSPFETQEGEIMHTSSSGRGRKSIVQGHTTPSHGTQEHRGKEGLHVVSGTAKGKRGDGLPELEDLLYHHLPSHDILARKGRRRFEREKSLERLFNSQRDDPSVFDFPDQEESGITSEFLNGSSNVPLSPPRSGSSSAENPRDQSPVFRYPLGVTPSKPPTPAASSEPRVMLNRNHTYTSSGHTTSLEEEDKFLSSTSDADNDETQDQARLRRMARRIHGVLPATYLRLGSKPSNLPPQSSMSTFKGAARDLADLPSVARKVHSSGRRDQDKGQDRATVFLSSDDSSSESEARVRNGVTRHDEEESNADEGIFHFDTFDEVIEDSAEIDFMAPRRYQRRTTGTSNRPKKRQRRLDDRREKKGSDFKSDPPYPKSMTGRIRYRLDREDGQPSHQRRINPSNASWPAKLGILDSPDIAQIPKHNRPQFLRIAARKARPRKGQGRMYPNYRHILLPTTGDTKDLDTGFEAWQLDTTPQDVSSKPRATEDRPALSELSNLQQNIHADLRRQSIRKRPLDQSGPEDATSAETRVSDDDTEPHQEADNGPRPPFISQQKIYNKFKKGSLLTTFGATTKPRAAQAEQEKLLRRSRGSSSTNLKASTSSLASKAPKDELKTFRLERFLGNRSREDNNPVSISMTSGHPYAHSKSSQPRRARKRLPRSLHASHEGLKANQNRLDEPSRPVDHTVLVGRHDLIPFEELDVGRLPMHNAFEPTSIIGSGEFSQLVSTVFFANDGASSPKVKPKAIFGRSNTNFLSWCEKLHSDAVFDPSETMSFVGSDWIPQVSSDKNTDYLGLREDQIEDANGKVMSMVTFIFYRLRAKSTGFQTQFIGEVLKVNAKLLWKLGTFSQSVGVATIPHRASLIALASRLALLSFKAWHVARVLDDSTDLYRCAESQLKDVLRSILYVNLEPSGIEALRKRSHREGYSGQKEFGPEDVEAESIVVVNNIMLLYKNLTGFGSIWEFIKEIMSKTSSPSEARIIHREKSWKVLFTLLPFLEISSHGCRQEICQQPEDTYLWKIVQDLLNPTVTTFDRLATDSLFYRCYCLAISWGWNITPDALNVMLEMLLLQIDGVPLSMPTRSLDDILLFCHSAAERTGCSSSIALKLMAQSIYKRSQGDSVTARDASSLVAKIIPTLSCGNFRTPNKLDLALIRQQFDVLSIIYVSAPEISRPRLRQFKRLVSMQQASISVVQIGIELCKRMMSYELKTKQEIVEFTSWLDEIALDILGRWKRGQPTAAGTGPPSNPYLLSHQNLLIHSLSAVQNLTTQCTHGDQIRKVIPKDFLFQLFHSALKEIRLQDILPYGLSIIKGIVAWPRTENQLHQRGSEDDSQEFGTIDWAALDEERENERVNLLRWMLNHFYLPLKRLLSSVLRAESPWPRPTYEDIVKCWACVAHSLVREGLREWSAYLGPHADDSWAHFEDCTRRNEGMILFLTEIMKSNQYFYLSHQETVLKSYVKGLIDLDVNDLDLSSLHRLILSSAPDDCMCQCINPEQTRSEIVSTMIINMQQIWHAYSGIDLNNGTFKLAKELGHYLIHSMANCWRNSRHDSILVAQRKVDMYSSVIHALLIYLPEYAPHLEFFTKGNEFPYKDTAIFVRVQDYARQLLEAKNVGKAFITYVHGLLENAAANSGGDDLLTQVILAMGLNIFTDNLTDETIQHAEKVRSGETVPLVSAPLPTAVDTRETHLLRLFLLGNVFPSYIANAFTPTGRFLFKPILGILTRAYEALSLYSNQWDDSTRLRRVTQEVLDISRTALASSLLQEDASLHKSTDLIRDYQYMTEGLEQLIDLAEATIEYMDRVRECEAEDTDEHEARAKRDGDQTILAMHAFSTARERELSRYTERTINGWMKQVERRQGAYFVRGKCIGPV